MRPLIIPQKITQREYRSLNQYFNEISKIDMISNNEEVVLAQSIKAGSQVALKNLTKANLRFVVSVAKQYQNQGLSLCDLINEGNIGLIIAARRYDETKGFKFISYAIWWIRQSIIKAISEHARMVRLPYNQLRMMSKLFWAVAGFEQDYGRKPSKEELSQYIGICSSKISDSFWTSSSSVSLDAPFSDENDNRLLDVLENNEDGPDREAIADSVRKEVLFSLRCLSERDRKLLIMYFGLESNAPLSLTEIGEKLNITKEHVGRLKEKALEKLRKCSYAPVLLSCLC